MDFMRLLQSIEELLYELVTWVLFYPLTLARCLVRPIYMMGYAAAELKDDAEGQYDDALSPPIFLLITLFITQMLEPVFLGSKVEVLQGVLADPRNLLIFQAVAYSVFPLLFALQHLRKHSARITRKTLKPAFYSQCYTTVPFALSINCGVMLGQFGGTIATVLGVVLVAAGLVWYLAVQVLWFASGGAMSVTQASVATLITMVQALLVMLLVLVGAAVMVINPLPAT